MLQERLLEGIASYAALLAVLLGCIGIYGLLSYSVSARVPEIGVRLALGATTPSVVGLLLRDGVLIVGAGMVLGVPCALAAGRLARAQLYGLAPGDPVSLAATIALFGFSGLVAALLPALRAARVDPMSALRAE